MDEQPDASLSKELSIEVPTGAAHADAATQTDDLSDTQGSLSDTQGSLSDTQGSLSETREDLSQTQANVAKMRWLPSFLGFEPSEEPDQDELNAEITQGHWRCHLKRIVKLDRGARSDPEFYRDRRPINASWNGIALSRPYAQWEESTDTT